MNAVGSEQNPCMTGQQHVQMHAMGMQPCLSIRLTHCSSGMQVFNEINSRKLGDSSLNVFKGMTKSRAFMYVIVITVTLQIIIVSTPLATVFITVRQNFWEWLFALLVGAGGLGVSAMTKLITWHMQGRSGGSADRHQEELLTLNSDA